MTIFLVLAVALIAIIAGVVLFFMPGGEKSQASPSSFTESTIRSDVFSEKSSFTKAGPNKRVCGYLIDVIVVTIPNLLLQSTFPAYGWIIPLAYFLCRDCFNGQSIGKVIVGTQVINDRGQVVEPLEGIIRNIFLAAAGVLPIINKWLAPLALLIPLAEYISLVRDPNGQRIGDKISQTRVRDLRPHIGDKIFLLISIVLLIIIGAVNAGIVSKISNSHTLAAGEYRNEANKFACKIPADFSLERTSKTDGGIETIGFLKTDGKIRISVATEKRDTDTIMSDQLLNEYLVNPIAEALGAAAKDILSRATLGETTIDGHRALWIQYNIESVKAQRVFFVAGYMSYSIDFYFYGDDIDSELVNQFWDSFKTL